MPLWFKVTYLIYLGQSWRKLVEIDQKYDFIAFLLKFRRRLINFQVWSSFNKGLHGQLGLISNAFGRSKGEGSSNSAETMIFFSP